MKDKQYEKWAAANNYRVTMYEEEGDKFTIVFDCFADDYDHAYEQAEDAYPGCIVINATSFDG